MSIKNLLGDSKKFRIPNTGMYWKLVYGKNEIGSYRTKKAATIDRDFFISRYGM